MIANQLNAGISLADVLPSARFLGTARIFARSCSRDSREVQPGDVFVAMEGSAHDGHNFVGDAISKGCQAIVAERPLPVRGIPVCLVDDSSEAYGRICQALAGSPSESLSVVGITGTSGKTTTAALVQSILTLAGGRAGAMTSLGYDDQSLFHPPAATAVDPPLLAQWLGRMDASHCTHAVVEASSEMLSRRVLAGTQLDVACVTNVRRNHLRLHNSLEGYRAVKASILRYLRPDGTLIVDGQDPFCVRLLDQHRGSVLTVGIDHAADLSASILEQNLGEQRFLLQAGSEAAAVRTRMVGEHHVRDCLLAAATCYSLGVDLTTIARGLESLESLPGRMQRLACGQGFAAFVDLARTADELSIVLAWLKRVTPGRVHCVFGGNGESDREMRLRIGLVASRLADTTVLTSGYPSHSECDPPQWIAAEILDGFDDPHRAHLELDRPAAIRWALNRARPGDSVLIAGVGDSPYHVTGSHTQFDTDSMLAESFLRDHGAVSLPIRLAA